MSKKRRWNSIASCFFMIGCAIFFIALIGIAHFWTAHSFASNAEERSQTIICPSCGYVCDQGWSYCIACGFSLIKLKEGKSSDEKVDPKVLRGAERAVFSVIVTYKELPLSSQITAREIKKVMSLLKLNKAEGVVLRRCRSGWLFDEHGHIVTSAEILEKAETIKVRFWSNEERDAKVIGYDLPSGVGVVKIEGELPAPLKIGKPGECKMGTNIWVIGYPIVYRSIDVVQHLPQKVAKAMLTGINKTNLNALQVENYLQTDISANFGMYGGILINESGEVLGMVTESIDEAVTVANSVDVVREIADKIVKGEKINRSYIGAGISKITPFLQEKFKIEQNEGIIVEYTIPGSPSEEAGLQKGDLILSMDGKTLSSTFLYQKEIMTKEPGQEVAVQVKRGGQKLALSVKSMERPAEIFLHPLDEIEQYYGLYFTEESKGFVSQQGLKVAGMLPGSLADYRGFELGDLLYKIEDLYMVSTYKDFNEILTKVTKDIQESKLLKDMYKTFRASFKIRRQGEENKLVLTYYSNYSNYYYPMVM